MPTAVSRHSATPNRCISCPVCDIGLCSWFDDTSATEVARRARQTRFAQGSSILVQGEAMTRVGVIISGLAKVVLVDEGGGEHLLQLLHAGELVGDPFASECAFSVDAATDTELCWLSPALLITAMQQDSGAYHSQLEATTRQANELRFAQAALRGRNAQQRLANWLYLQLPEASTPKPLRLRILLSRRDLASLLDMTVETLCRVLHQIEERGAIRLISPELVEIKDRARLRVLARGQDDRLQETLLRAGWEWGAKPVAPSPWLAGLARHTAAKSRMARPENDPERREGYSS